MTRKFLISLVAGLITGSTFAANPQWAQVENNPPLPTTPQSMADSPTMRSPMTPPPDTTTNVPVANMNSSPTSAVPTYRAAPSPVPPSTTPGVAGNPNPMMQAPQATPGLVPVFTGPSPISAGASAKTPAKTKIIDEGGSLKVVPADTPVTGSPSTSPSPDSTPPVAPTPEQMQEIQQRIKEMQQENSQSQSNGVNDSASTEIPVPTNLQ